MGLVSKGRELQVYFPQFQDLRFKIQFNLRAIIGKPHESDFYGLEHIKLPEYPTFIDAGSNRGESIQSMKLFYPNASIFAFEANPAIIDKMWQPLLDDNVKITNIGLGDQSQKATLYVPYYRKWLHDGYSSFDKSSIEPLLKLIYQKYDPALLHIEKFSFDIKPLDDFNLKPDFIKIDVQGFEYQVLKGAHQTLQTSLPVLFIEGINDEIQSLLEPMGYDFYCYTKDGFRKGTDGLNTYCISKDKYKFKNGTFMPTNNTSVPIS